MAGLRSLCYLLQAGSGIDPQPAISSTRVTAADGKMHDLCVRLFEDAPHECNVDIVFNPIDGDVNQNIPRQMAMDFASRATVSRGEKLATRLQAATTKRSGHALLFAVKGRVQSGATRLVLSRFPADVGVLADTANPAAGLTVEFVDRVFMKRLSSYKSVLYEEHGQAPSFDRGKAVDRQVNAGDKAISQYWIQDFLCSSFAMTDALGTKRLAMGLRNTLANVTNLTLKRELVTAAMASGGLDGRVISIDTLGKSIPLTPQAEDALRGHGGNAETRALKFRFDAPTFEAALPLRSIVLDTGVMVTGPSGTFGDLVTENPLEDADKGSKMERQPRVELRTQGSVVNDSLGRTPTRRK